MPARTSPSQVIGVLRNGSQGGDYDDLNAPPLDPYIASANLTVTRVAAMALAKGTPLTADELEMLERLLAAHDYCCSDKRYQSKSTSGASGSFQGQTGQGFESTDYGQRALRLDYSFCLEQLDKKKRARLRWLGKPPSAQIPYRDRS